MYALSHYSLAALCHGSHDTSTRTSLLKFLSHERSQSSVCVYIYIDNFFPRVNFLSVGLSERGQRRYTSSITGRLLIRRLLSRHKPPIYLAFRLINVRARAGRRDREWQRHIDHCRRWIISCKSIATEPLIRPPIGTILLPRREGRCFCRRYRLQPSKQASTYAG